MAFTYKRPIADVYRDIVNINENNGGWAGTYYGTVSNIINEFNYKTVVEVGIGYGTHAKQLLKNTKLDKLYLVDPMKFYENDGFADDIASTIPTIPNNQFNDLYDLINKELSPWSDRYTWFRKESLNINNSEILDESIDCVFVDGDHSYNAVKQDLPFWWRKVKKGGIMLGDDYWMSDVARAVQEFATQNKLELNFANNPANPTYKIFYFRK